MENKNDTSSEVLRLNPDDFNTLIRVKDDNSYGEIAKPKKQEPMLMIMTDVDSKPSLYAGKYWLRISGSGYYVRLFEKPNFIKRFFMNKLLGIKFYEAKEN